MRSRLHHIALGARDPERVAAFYRDAIGLSELSRHREEDGSLRSVWLDLGGAILMVERTTRSRARVEGVDAGAFLIALRVQPDERAELEARLEGAGAPVESRSPYSSYVRDPEGNRVAISHYPDPPSDR